MVTLVYDGVSSNDLGLKIEREHKIPIPKRKITSTSVSGRNGDIILEEDAYENVTISYSIWAANTTQGIPELTATLEGWLLTGNGYKRLEESNDPDVYRLAHYIGGTSLTNVLNLVGGIEISFDADPRRFLKSGERSYVINNHGILRNPTKYDALPIITVTGTGSGNLLINDTVCQINKISDKITIDCEKMNCYLDGVSRNADVKIPEFPKLKAGNNIIQYTDGVTGVSIIPNWWTL